MDSFEHGATDSGPEPDADFSSCAHPLGPCPSVLEAVLGADRSRYPDPSYAELRERLGVFHGVGAERIVPGAGASELILRVVRSVSGAVLSWSPSFVEYHRSAHVCGRPFLSASDRESWLSLVPEGGAAFLCQPNNPDGTVHGADFLESARSACAKRGCRLVLDLAYADFCLLPAFPGGAELLFAPNKTFGLVGVRSAYLVASDAAWGARLREAAPSWVVGAEGESFLLACVEPDARRWISERTAKLYALARGLRLVLERAGWESLPSSTHFLSARPPSIDGIPDGADLSAAWTRRLRQAGVRVRDLSNTGLPGWLRLSARPKAELGILERVLCAKDLPGSKSA